MKRIYEHIIRKHFDEDDMMLFLAGPRQCGKTTCSQMVADHYQHSVYLNWDEREHRQLILEGSSAIAVKIQLETLHEQKVCVVFDELHKYQHWKQFLKGFYDLYKDKTHIIVTGSSRLNIFKRGGDSLMGRYFLYRMHPLSVAECLTVDIPDTLIRPQQQFTEEKFNHLYEFGGYPKPYLRSSVEFSNRWQRLRSEQLVREDIRDATRIQELGQLDLLIELLKLYGSKQLNFSKLANKINVTAETITRWIKVLNSFYYCFTLKPWHKNIARALTKEPKIYLWDWSLIQDPGQRFENFIASHLHKAVHYWTDMGYGNFELHYIRTLDKKEVDFIVTKDNDPWFLVEAKHSGKQAITSTLRSMHQLLQTEHAFQVCYDLPFVDKNCFECHDPTIVPARTFLSQLI